MWMEVVVEEEKVEVAKTGAMRGAALNEYHGHQVSSLATLDPDEILSLAKLYSQNPLMEWI